MRLLKLLGSFALSECLSVANVENFITRSWQAPCNVEKQVILRTWIMII